MKRRNLLAGLFGLPIAAAAAVVAPKAVAADRAAADTRIAALSKRIANILGDDGQWWVDAGPVIDSIPEPSLPLNAVGMAKYRELAEALYRDGKLTAATVATCEIVAVHWQCISARLEAGRQPSLDSLRYIASATKRLRIGSLA